MAQKQLEKQNLTVSDDVIVIHIVDQMYKSDWFSEETMAKWEEINYNNKTWLECQQFFEDAYTRVHAGEHQQKVQGEETWWHDHT